MNTDGRSWLVILLGAAMLLATSICLAATPVPSGKWRWEFKDMKGRADRPIRVYTYRPKLCDSRCPIMFVLHGMKRDGSAYRDYWELLADRNRVLIIAPEFSKDVWPKAAAYNLGDVAEQADREKWTYSAIEHLFDEMRDGQVSYAIFGHSAGGQFVQRMAIFRPDNRASVMIAANPGWYLMPEWRKDKEKAVDAYPYSLVGAKVGEAELRQALPKRLILLVGENDDDPDDENLNKSAGAMKQGANRVERGENFIKAATAAASDLGVKLAWELNEVPNVAHSGSTMSRIAAETLYGKK
jgi:pimeloyl-ACP methyl ester carboxylesterase